MELRHLRYFVAVAEELNFRRAAERLHIAQPPLSAQIKALEGELGIRLLERTTRSVALSHAGRVFLEEARAVLAASADAERRAKEAAHGLVGTLRLGVIAPVANAWLAAVLRRFRERFPSVTLAIFDLNIPEQLRRVRERELDAGLVRPPVGFPELDFQFVEEAEQVLALPTGHRLARKRQLDWSDFDGEAMVMVQPNMQHGYYDAFLAACAKAGAKPRVAQYANDIQIKLWLVSAGFGLAPTTATLAEIHRPGLAFRRLPQGLPRVQTILAWRKDDHSPVLAHFRSCFPPFRVGTEAPKS
jgi:DNA-binding transcriptional LysR family regulator